MTSLNTHIHAVTVYTDRARVSRQGRISLPAGLHTLEIENLPANLDADSLRVAARSQAAARLLAVKARKTFHGSATLETLRRLENEIEALQDQMRALDAQTEQAKQQRAALTAIAGHSQIFATALAAGESSLENQLAAFDGLRARAASLDGEMLDLAKTRREQERTLQKLQNELNQQRGSRPRERYCATVVLEMGGEGDIEVNLSYVVAGAGWKPLYDLRLLEPAGEATLEVGYLAQVTQHSGEAWEDVALTLSTARPALATTAPELDPWRLKVGAPPVMRGMPARAAMEMQAVAPAPQMAASDTLGAMPDIEELHAEVGASGAAVTYTVAGSSSIPPDGEAHTVTVARFPLIPRLDYVSAPKRVAAVYRRARLVNASPYTLLPGAANLFDGDEFLGATSIELTPPQAEWELYLGVDDRIHIERELKRRDIAKVFIGGKRRMQFGFEIALQNLLPSPATITLRDQLPLSPTEDVKVKLDNAEPRPDEHSELNLLTWKITLKPNEKLALRFDFSVEAPQGTEVGGLP